MNASKLALSALSIATLLLPLAANASMDTDVPDGSYVALGNRNQTFISYKEDTSGNLISNNEMKTFQWVKFGNNRGIFRLAGTDITLTPTNSTLGLSLYSPNKGQVFTMKPAPTMGGMYNIIDDNGKMICTKGTNNTVLQMAPVQPGITIPNCEFGIVLMPKPQVVVQQQPTITVKPVTQKQKAKIIYIRSNRTYIK